MVTSPQAIANKFISLAKLEHLPLSVRKLHMLIYIANGISYAVMDKPIQYCQIYAKNFGIYISKGVSNEYIDDDEVCEDACDIIHVVWQRHKFDSLMKLTHDTCKKGTPFYDTLRYYRGSIVENMVISEKLIQDYYIKVIHEGRYII